MPVAVKYGQTIGSVDVDGAAGWSMKVLFVFSIGRLHGGAARVWFNLLDTLPSRGVEPFVVIPQDVDHSMTAQLERRGIPWCEAFFTWWVTSDAHPRSLAHRIRRKGAKLVNRAADRVIGNFIERNGIELVYICDGTITAGLREAERRGIPVVWHIHQFIEGDSGTVSFIDPEAHVGSTFARATAIITVSEGIRAYLRTRFPTIRKITAIYNGVSPDCVFDKERVLDGPTVVFTLVGRIDENKGQLDALRAFAQVAHDFPEARLHFVGTGDKAISCQLEELVDHEGIAGQVVFEGARDDMPAVWAETDVALNCSYSEGCSMAVAEAMSSGCLLLCSTAEGNVELVDGRYGLLYERGKADALAAKMLWVLENREQARAIAAAGKRRARKLFDLQRQADAVYRVFTEALA